jgi:hypothetical protein
VRPMTGAVLWPRCGRCSTNPQDCARELSILARIPYGFACNASPVVASVKRTEWIAADVAARRLVSGPVYRSAAF